MSETLSEILKDREFCLLTTFKKDGRSVATPMWFAMDGETLCMTTRGNSWKVKRIKNNPEVTIAWCDSSGKKHGKLYAAKASLQEDPEQREQALKRLNKKYGLKKKLIDFGLKFAKDKTEAIVEVELLESN